ncbi:MAG: ABC transporter substrate-binding protein, partial [Pseudomonadota bacterium]
MTSRSDKVLSRDKRKYLLKSERVWGVETHAYMPELCDQLDTGGVTRRDFVRQACLLGVSTGIAYGLADSIEGVRPFAPALASSPKPGGTLRVAMDVQEMSDPATFPWVQRSNVARFIVEHLTRTRADNITVPYLAESWEASDDLTQWVFKLRQGVTWSNGDRFTSQYVAHTMARWLDPEGGGRKCGGGGPRGGGGGGRGG